LGKPALSGETINRKKTMLADKISGYAELKSKLDDSTAIVEAKSAEIDEINNKITANNEQLTAVQEQLKAAPLQMAKNALSNEEFIRLRYDEDALQAMIDGLNELKAAQSLALSSLTAEKNELQKQLDVMISDYVRNVTDKSVLDTVVAVNEPLKFFVSSVITGEKYGTKSDEVYRQIGLQLSKLIYGEQNVNMARIPDFDNARKYVDSVKKSFLTEV